MITDDELQELHGLLHTLWSKADTSYDKAQWMRFERLILKLVNEVSPGWRIK